MQSPLLWECQLGGPNPVLLDVARRVGDTGSCSISCDSGNACQEQIPVVQPGDHLTQVGIIG